MNAVQNITCKATGETRPAKVGKAGPKLPMGWRRLGGDVYSPAGWKSKYVARAVTLPIVAPVVPRGSGAQSETFLSAWKEFDAAIKEAWSRSTNAAAWAMKELLKNDVTRDPSTAKCPKMPPIYLYGLGDWIGWASSASAVLRNVETAYRAKRYEIVWLGKSSLPNIRFPYPYPVPSSTYSLSIDEGGRPVFSARLPAGRVNVWLKGGANYRRQRKQLEWLIDNPELIGEAAIYQRGKDVMVKIVGWFPRKQIHESNGTMHVRTDSESFLVALNDKDERLFIIHGDRCRRWITRHQYGLQRWRDDQKAELRKPKRENRKYGEDMQAAIVKHRNRINSFIDMTASQIVGHASRRKLAMLRYDDSYHDYFLDFPWFRLATAIEQRCQAAGIIFERRCNTENTVVARNEHKEN